MTGWLTLRFDAAEKWLEEPTKHMHLPLHPHDPGFSYAIARSPSTHPTCIPVYVTDPRASRIHCIFSWHSAEKCWCVHDNKSTNGTFVNAERLEPNMRKPVRVGDVISVGKGSPLRWCVEPASAPAQPPDAEAAGVLNASQPATTAQAAPLQPPLPQQQRQQEVQQQVQQQQQLAPAQLPPQPPPAQLQSASPSPGDPSAKKALFSVPPAPPPPPPHAPALDEQSSPAPPISVAHGGPSDGGSEGSGAVLPGKKPRGRPPNGKNGRPKKWSDWEGGWVEDTFGEEAPRHADATALVPPPASVRPPPQPSGPEASLVAAAGAAAATAGALGPTAATAPAGAPLQLPRPAPLPGGAMLDTSTMLQVFGLGIPESLGFIMPEPPARKPLSQLTLPQLRKLLERQLPSVLATLYPHGYLFVVFAPGAPHTPTPIHATQERILRAENVASADGRLTIRSDAFAQAVHSGGSAAPSSGAASSGGPPGGAGEVRHQAAALLGGTLDDPTAAPPPPSVPPPSALLDGDAEVWQGWPKKRDWTAAQQHAAGDDGADAGGGAKKRGRPRKSDEEKLFLQARKFELRREMPDAGSKEVHARAAREWASAALCVGLKQRLGVGTGGTMPSSHLPPPPADGLAANAVLGASMMSNYVDIAAKVEANAAAGGPDGAPADAAGGLEYGVQIEEIDD